MIYLMCSEAKAKAAILYNYRNVMSGFSARLTPPELEAVKSNHAFICLFIYLWITTAGIITDYCLICGCRATSGEPGAAERDLVSNEQQVRRRQLIPSASSSSQQAHPSPTIK